MHYVKKPSLFHSLVLSTWKFRLLQILLVIPALVVLVASVLSLTWKTPSEVEKKNSRILKLETSITSLDSELSGLQSSLSTTRNDLAQIYNKNLGLRGIWNPDAAFCVTSSDKPLDECLEEQRKKPLLKNYQKILQEEKAKKVETPVPDVTAGPPTWSSPRERTVAKASGFKLKDTDLVIDSEKMSGIESHLMSVTRVVDLLVSEVQAIKSVLNSLADESKLHSGQTFSEMASLSGNLASVMSLLLAVLLAVYKKKKGQDNDVGDFVEQP
jgi:hypothetical protein